MTTQVDVNKSQGHHVNQLDGTRWLCQGDQRRHRSTIGQSTWHELGCLARLIPFWHRHHTKSSGTGRQKTLDAVNHCLPIRSSWHFISSLAYTKNDYAITLHIEAQLGWAGTRRPETTMAPMDCRDAASTRSTNTQMPQTRKYLR